MEPSLYTTSWVNLRKGLPPRGGSGGTGRPLRKQLGAQGAQVPESDSGNRCQGVVRKRQQEHTGVCGRQRSKRGLGPDLRRLGSEALRD